MLGFLGMIAGLVIYFEASEPFGGYLAAASVPIWLFGRAGAWWHHA
jgi:hypothetical protein